MDNVNIPPLKFTPILKSVVWGGEKIAPFKGIVTDQKNIGESWEISGVRGNESVVVNGPDAGLTLTRMIEKYGADLVGSHVYKRFGNTFPLLIKIIDAAGDLSLQVHPDDELARRRHNSLGKTEMWYIVDTDPDAAIVSGLSAEITPDEYAARVADNTLLDVVAHHTSHPGDVFFLPAGRIHSIGRGNFVLEIQEASDITYRIYDYDRRDAQGNPRQLHIEESVGAIDFNDIADDCETPRILPVAGRTQCLQSCPYFTTEVTGIASKTTLDLSGRDSFTIAIATEGHLTLTPAGGETVELPQGCTALIPASVQEVEIDGNGSLVTVHVQ